MRFHLLFFLITGISAHLTKKPSTKRPAQSRRLSTRPTIGAIGAAPLALAPNLERVGKIFKEFISPELESPGAPKVQQNVVSDQTSTTVEYFHSTNSDTEKPASDGRFSTQNTIGVSIDSDDIAKPPPSNGDSVPTTDIGPLAQLVNTSVQTSTTVDDRPPVELDYNKDQTTTTTSTSTRSTSTISTSATSTLTTSASTTSTSTTRTSSTSTLTTRTETTSTSTTSTLTTTSQPTDSSSSTSDDSSSSTKALSIAEERSSTEKTEENDECVDMTMLKLRLRMLVGISGGISIICIVAAIVVYILTRPKTNGLVEKKPRIELPLLPGEVADE